MVNDPVAMAAPSEAYN